MLTNSVCGQRSSIDCCQNNAPMPNELQRQSRCDEIATELIGLLAAVDRLIELKDQIQGSCQPKTDRACAPMTFSIAELLSTLPKTLASQTAKVHEVIANIRDMVL